MKGDQLSKRPIAMLAGVVAIAIVAAGCGSSGGGASTGATITLTKVEFIKQGDAICAKDSKKLEAEGKAFIKDNGGDGSNLSKKDEEKVIATIFAPSLQAQADELSELDAPQGEEGKTAAIIDALEAAAEKLEDDPASLLESHQGPGPLDKPRELAEEFGFKECGRG